MVGLVDPDDCGMALSLSGELWGFISCYFGDKVSLCSPDQPFYLANHLPPCKGRGEAWFVVVSFTVVTTQGLQVTGRSAVGICHQILIEK